jgi:hypothetical protein
MSLARNGAEATIYILPGGAAEFRLDDVASGCYLEDVSGLGMPGVSHVARRGYGQDGETWLAARLNPRVISLSVAQVYRDRGAMWAGHQDWFAAFAPGDHAGTLRKVLPDGRKFDLPVRFQGGMDAGTAERFGVRVQRYVVQLVAHDPIWRSPDTFTLSAEAVSGDELVYPMTYPYTYDPDTILEDLVVDYAGTWRTWPVVTIHGPVSSPTLHHVERGVTVRLERVVPAHEAIVIVFDPVEPGVETITGLDLTAFVSDAYGDLAGFYLERGTNTVRVMGGNVATGTTFTLAYAEQFVGV